MSCSSEDVNPEPQQFSPDEIQGNWYSLGGNNPEYNGMLVNVANNFVSVNIPAGSAFNVGDVKWKEIVGNENKAYYGFLIV